MSADISAQDVYKQMKEIYDRCSKQCVKLEKDRKYMCLNACDQHTRRYSASRTSQNQGDNNLSEMLGVSYDEFVADSSVFKEK